MWSGVRAQGASKQAWAGFEQFLAGRKRERCSVQIRSKDAEGRVRAPCTGGPPHSSSAARRCKVDRAHTPTDQTNTAAVCRLTARESLQHEIQAAPSTAAAG
jgi:hypothetical protein